MYVQAYMAQINEYLHNCLYFTASRLARLVSEMAGEEFTATGLSPSHAFMMMLVNANPGITPATLGESLHLAPSTITRLADKLEAKGYIERRSEGKFSYIHPTEKGNLLQEAIEKAWEALYERYCAILGTGKADTLNRLIDRACETIGKK